MPAKSHSSVKVKVHGHKMRKVFLANDAHNEVTYFMDAHDNVMYFCMSSYLCLSVTSASRILWINYAQISCIVERTIVGMLLNMFMKQKFIKFIWFRIFIILCLFVSKITCKVVVAFAWKVSLSWQILLNYCFTTKKHIVYQLFNLQFLMWCQSLVPDVDHLYLIAPLVLVHVAFPNPDPSCLMRLPVLSDSQGY